MVKSISPSKKKKKKGDKSQQKEPSGEEGGEPVTHQQGLQTRHSICNPLLEPRKDRLGLLQRCSLPEEKQDSAITVHNQRSRRKSHWFWGGGEGGDRSAGKKEKERRKNTHLLPQQKLMIPALLLLLLLDLLGAAPLFLFQTLDASLLHLQLRVIGGFFLDQALQGGGCD
jgi:hypothetical protein